MRGFGDNLKRKRTDAGLTQVELEREAGLPATLISQYEHGSRKPGVDAIIALCRGLRCSADDLLFGSTKQPAGGVAEAHNIRKVERTGDQSVTVTLASCRAASAFERAMKPKEDES